MKAPKSVALGLAAALAASGVVSLATTGAAQAATQSFQLYSQVNPGVQPVPVNLGSQSVSLTVTPAAAEPGAPIEVSVSSSTLAFENGPATTAAANSNELVAVVSLNGVDYALRGSQLTQPIPPADGSTTTAPTNYKAGWVISSEPGNSSSTSNDGEGVETAGTTGIGATVRAAETTPVELTAPATIGTYPIVLKALIVNSIAGSGTPALNNGFDQIINTSSTAAKNDFNNNVASSYFAFSPSVDLTVAGPNATIATSTGQNAGVQAFRTAASYATTLGLTGSVWDASQAAGSFTVAFCDVAGTSCDTVTGPGVTNTIATNASGELTGNIVIPAGSGGITAGNRTIKLTNGSDTALVPVKVLTSATTSITTSPAEGYAGTVVTVTGSGFNPGQEGIVRGAKVAEPPFTTTSDASVTFTANAAGELPATQFTVNDPTTVAIIGAQGPGFPLGPNNASAFKPFTFLVDTSAPTGTAAVDPETIWVGNATTLTISGVTDNKPTNQVSATVNWGDGSAAQEIAAGVTTANHTYAANGNYSVSVVLEDAAGNASEPIAAGTVVVTTPAGNFTRTPSILWATQAAKITPSGIGTDVNTVSVNWGDGTSSASVSKTSATSHIYKSTGFKTITVTFKNTATGNTYSKAIGRVAVYKDTYKPVVGLANPKNATKGSSWTTVKGTILDKGLGPKSVTVQAIQKRGSKYYALTNSGWKKASSKTAALRAAKKITDTTVSTRFWAVKLSKPAKGSLYVYYSGVDRANNKSAVKIKSQTIKS